MNHGSGYPGHAQPGELRPSARKSQEAQQDKQKGGRPSCKLQCCPQIRSASSSTPSSSDTPSSPTRIQSAASPSSLKTAPSARWCLWTVRLASGTTSRSWPRSSVRSPGPPGDREGSRRLAEKLSLSGEGGGSHCHQASPVYRAAFPAWITTTRQASWSLRLGWPGHNDLSVYCPDFKFTPIPDFPQLGNLKLLLNPGKPQSAPWQTLPSPLSTSG